MASLGRQGLVLTALVAGAAGALASSDAGDRGQAEDHVGIFQTIVVDQEHPAADVACLFCTVRVEGPVQGDIALLFGTVRVEGPVQGDLAVLFGTLDVAADQEIHGDVATLFSTATVGDDARVDGDMMVALGTSQIAPSAVVRGDRAIFSSRLGLAVTFGPLLLVLGLIWLAIWGFRLLLAR